MLIRARQSNAAMALQQEIEIKAHITEEAYVQLHDRLRARARVRWEFCKNDAYYCFSHNTTVRIREEKGKGTFLSYKEKNSSDNAFENNTEYETEIADAAVLHTVLRKLEPRHYIEKTKKGTAFLLEHSIGTEIINVVAELVNIASLGYFIELEYLNKNISNSAQNTPGKISVKAAQGALLELLKELGISRDAIEVRYYIDMLRLRKTNFHKI